MCRIGDLLVLLWPFFLAIDPRNTFFPYRYPTTPLFPSEDVILYLNYADLSPEFFNSGSTDEQTIRENSSVFSKYRLRSRVLVDVSKCDTGTVLWGNKLWMPLGVSPAGAQGIAHADGELATARACARRNVPMGVSSFANFQVDEICAAGRAASQTFDAAMQIYTMRDRALMERVVRRAEDAGCRAVFLTGDSPVLGVRYNEWRNDFRVPSHLGFPNIEWTSERWRLQTHDQGFTGFNDNAHSWARDIPWLRKRTKMEIWIKGVLTAEDTRLAIESGCDGIIVSNHGGRQLDGVPASLDALVECVEAAKGSNLRIHVDGGFRRGSDVFIALALGAECCWVGRPTLWGLAVSSNSNSFYIARSS